MMSGIAFVQRRGGQLVAAVVAQNPLLLLFWQARIGNGDIEPARAVAAISPRAVVGGVRNHRAHERRRRNHTQWRFGNGRQLPLLHKITSASHFPGVGVDQLVRCGVIAAQLVDKLRPRLASVQLLGEAHEIRLDFLLEPQAVAPQLRRRIAERMLIVEQEVERFLADREVLGSHFQPALEIRVEREQRRARLLCRGRETGGVHRRLRAKRGRELFDEQPAAFGHSHRRLDEDPHRLFQRGLEIIEELGDVFQAPDRRRRLLGGGTVGGEQQMMQPAEQMREPEFWVLGLRLQLLEAAQHDADLVQQRRAVDLLLEIGGVGCFQRGGNRLERREMGHERGRTETAVAVIMPRHASLCGRHRVQMPVEIEKRLLDVAQAHAFSNRWHSSSDRTRSVRFAASNSVRQASSSSGS